MKKIRFFVIMKFLLLSQIAFNQSNNCLTSFKNDLDGLLPLKVIKTYSQNFELDHYITGAGTDYVESQFYWYPDDQTTYSVRLYGIKKETANNPIEKYKRKVQQKSDDIYKYELADNIGDYAYWTTSNMTLESASTTDATLTVLYKNEKFVVQVDLGEYTKSQKLAEDLAHQIINKCK